MTDAEFIRQWCMRVRGSSDNAAVPADTCVFVDKLRRFLSDCEIVAVLEAYDEICPACFNALRPCKCTRED